MSSSTARGRPNREITERVTRCPGPEGATNYPVVIRPVLDGAGDI
ncbi:hypothetical protein [Streptomyces sp. NPDC090798]